MESELEPEDVRRALQAAFSFISVVFTWLVAGFLFLTLNAPLSRQWVTAGRHGTFFGVLVELRDFWVYKFPQNLSNKTFLFYGLIALIVGFTILPLGQYLALTVNQLTRLVIMKVKLPLGQDQEPPIYHPIALRDDYSKFTDWIHSHPRAKSAWKWEFFNYYLSVVIWMNILTASIILVCSTEKPGWWPAGILVFVVYATFHMYKRSQVLQNLFEHYKSKI